MPVAVMKSAMTPQREQHLLAEIDRLRAENELLRQRIDQVLRQLFGSKSEALDPAQLDLFASEAAKKAEAADGVDAPPAAEELSAAPPVKKRSPRKPRDHSHLEVRETLILHPAVQANPTGFREIHRISTDRYDFQPSVIFINRTTRSVQVPVNDPDGVPLKAPAPPSLGLSATPRLVARVLAGKYCDHLPFYRQQGIFHRNYGVDFPRNTFCHWTAVSADLCEPIYKLIHAGLLESDSLQGDETPVRYQNPGKGKCSTGYLWVIHAPRNGIKGDILYQWHPSRKAACLDDLLGNYRGYLQTDAYAGYDSWTADKDGIILVGCWAHARRKFHEAFKIGQSLAAGPLAAIARLYQVETTLRKARAGSAERAQVRQARATPLLQLLKADLIALRQRPEVLPKSALGKAIDYTLSLWGKLTVYVDQGQLEIDNNWIENGIRPTAIGKKNWLFIGGETTGQRSAILYTLIECARRHGHNPEAYLTDILERLPAMTNQDDLGVLLPSRWQPAAAATPASELTLSV